MTAGLIKKNMLLANGFVVLGVEHGWDMVVQVHIRREMSQMVKGSSGEIEPIKVVQRRAVKVLRRLEYLS